MNRVGRKRSNSATGAFGEDITATFITARGDEILDRNWRVREGEIDLISLGTDGETGGEGINADITNWNLDKE